MVYLSAFFSLLFVTNVLCDGGSLLIACSVDDMECFSKTTQQFLEQTCKGIPAYDIKPIDPLFLPSLDVKLKDETETILHYKNLTITGLKDQKFSDFKMDVQKKSVVLQTQANLNIVGDVEIEFSKSLKTFNGAYTIKGTALGTARYDYDFIVDAKGIEHFDVGPETLSCTVLGEPEVILSPELKQALEEDKDLMERKDRFYAKRKEIQREVFCKMVEKAYVVAIHNIRAAAKILPKSAFIKGV